MGFSVCHQAQSCIYSANNDPNMFWNFDLVRKSKSRSVCLSSLMQYILPLLAETRNCACCFTPYTTPYASQTPISTEPKGGRWNSLQASYLSFLRVARKVHANNPTITIKAIIGKSGYSYRWTNLVISGHVDLIVNDTVLIWYEKGEESPGSSFSHGMLIDYWTMIISFLEITSLEPLSKLITIAQGPEDLPSLPSLVLCSTISSLLA
jgi:hypothetical protein